MKKGSHSRSTKRQSALGVMTRVLRLRIKDKHAKHLLEQSREVNQVWNYCQETSLIILARERRFCTGYDLDQLTAGATKEGMSLHSQTLQAVSAEYCTRRRQFNKVKLRWRVSHGSRRSLGWIPVKASALSYRAGQVHYQGKALSLWDSYGLSDYELRSGSFSEDSRGRWYLNVTVDVKQPVKSVRSSSVGIDLGLKDLAALSNGQTVEANEFYRDLEPALAAPKLTISGYTHCRAQSKCCHLAQISFSLNGAFWPTSLPLFHGSWWDLLLESSMMNSLKLKGIQLSCVLTGVAILIVSFGAGSLKFQIVIRNHERPPKFPECPTL